MVVVAIIFYSFNCLLICVLYCILQTVFALVCLHARLPPFHRIVTSPHHPRVQYNVNRARITRQCFASGFRRFFYSIFTARQLL
jgi:hypothetical protein